MKYSPREVFMPFHLRDKRWSCIVAHRRAGKTVACINELLTRALATKKENARYAYIAPYYAQAKQIAWDYLKAYGQEIIVKNHESELQVELFHGSRIRLFGADNPNALRGLYFDGAILDEYADMRPSVWPEVIRPALTDRKGWAVFIGTPKGNNEFYKIHQHAKMSDDWYSLVLKASESGLLPQEELIDAQKTMSEDQYAQEFECSFTAAIIGSYYGTLINQANAENRITSVPYSPSSSVITAWDLGYGDSTAIWFAQIVGKEPRIIDYYESNGVGLDHYVKIIREKPYNYSEHFLPHDAASGQLGTGKSLSDQLTGMGIKNTVLQRPDIDAGIQFVRQLIPQCWFDETKCAAGLEALKNYQKKYDEDKKVFMAKPLHNWASHGADAFRYLATGLSTLKSPVVRKPAPMQQHSSHSWMG